MLGIASGLEYLHSLKPTVVHGDLRAVWLKSAVEYSIYSNSQLVKRVD